MSAQAAQGDAGAGRQLVFSGHEPGFIPWTLLGFILLSAVVHAFGFYIFQTIYPAVARVGPPPVQVGLLVPGTPGADAILRWIDSEDPALAAQPGKAPIPGLMSLPYIPSYQSVHARPTMATAAEPPLPYPDGASGLDLVKMAASRSAGPAPAGAPTATTLSFSGPLVVAGPLPSFSGLHSAGGDALEPTRFLLGVSDQGDVKYVFLQDFLQESSGDPTLNASAASLLQQVKFRPSAEPLTWGFATFYWGPEVYAQPTPAAEVAK
jgi:hypothetical protein